LFWEPLPLNILGGDQLEVDTNSFTTVLPKSTVWLGQIDPQ